MKKIVYGFLALFMLASVSSNLSFATENKGGFGSEVASGGVRGQGFDDDQANFLNGGARGVGGNTAMKGDSILTSVKKFINWALGMLATVALVLCLWGGFKMMTAGGDDTKYKEGINILKKAAIGLVVIGGAWMLVSVVMWLIGSVTS